MSANENEMLASEGRRLLLKSLAAGGAAAAFLPDKWTKPVIDRILVPAHAQGSPGLYGIYTNNGSGRLFTSNFQPGMFERLANMIIPVANAGENGLMSCNSLCIAMDVKTNNSVIGYVAGSQGISSFDPDTRSIANIFVNTCGSYSLSNCMINVDGSELTGYIAASKNNDCYAGYFSLERSAVIPNACSFCQPE